VATAYRAGRQRVVFAPDQAIRILIVTLSVSAHKICPIDSPAIMDGI
jgi:hypothetical protein